MGFINFRGGQQKDNFTELSEQAKLAESEEQKLLEAKRRRRLAADYFGVSELAERSNTAVLAQLSIRYQNLTETYSKLCRENQLDQIFDHNQFMKDFWMSSFAQILDQGDLDNVQKARCLQILLVAFKVDNKTMAREYYMFMEKNENYRSYMQRCFSISEHYFPLVWNWMQHLGYQPLPGEGRHSQNRMDSVIYFMRQYVSFMLGLSFYISQLFPGHGCGRNTRDLLQDKMEEMIPVLSEQNFIILDISRLINPVFYDPEDYKSDYKGFEQNRMQAEGLKGALESLKNNFGKAGQTRRLLRLLDMCSDSDVNPLESEYKRATSII